MTDRAAFVTGAGLAAGLMYLLDPDGGRRRRALARDKLASALAQSEDALGATGRDMANRARDVIARARTAVRGERDTPDPVVAERVRAKLGHHVSHPGSIEVVVAGGRVILAGPVLVGEVDDLVRAVQRVRGVRDVESRLEVHQGPDDAPGLQGGVPMQSSWSPAARALAGAAGAGLVLSAAARRGLLAGVLGALGFAMLARAATNVDLRRLVRGMKTREQRGAGEYVH
jgi:hypothetical protein